MRLLRWRHLGPLRSAGSCARNPTEFIDHIVFDKRAIAFADRTSFRDMTFRQADKPVWDKISDHCPVIVEMWVK